MPYTMGVSISTVNDKATNSTGAAAIIHWRGSRPRIFTDVIDPPARLVDLKASTTATNDTGPTIITSNPLQNDLPTPPSSVSSPTKSPTKADIAQLTREANIAAFTMALEAAVERKNLLKHDPYFQLFINADSKFINDNSAAIAKGGSSAVGGLNANEAEMVDQAADLIAQIQKRGFVAVKYTPRAKNRHAVWAAKKAVKGEMMEY